MTLSGRGGRSLVDVLHTRAGENPGGSACTFLENGEEEDSCSLTWAELDRRARALAAHLHEIGVDSPALPLAPWTAPCRPCSGSTRFCAPPFTSEAVAWIWERVLAENDEDNVTNLPDVATEPQRSA
jgi:hypothetical protein